MSLELQGTITGNVRKYGAKADKTNDGKTAVVDIELDLTEAQAKKLGGPLFASTCFSDFVGGSAATTVDKKRLGGELKIKAEHKLEIGDYKITTKPKVTDLVVSAKERLVTVTLRLEVDGSAKKLRRLLDDSVGDDVEIKFGGAAQTEIPGTEDKRMGFTGKPNAVANKGKKRGKQLAIVGDDGVAPAADEVDGAEGN